MCWSLSLFPIRVPGDAAHWPEMTVSWLGVTVQVHSLKTQYAGSELCQKLIRDPPWLWAPRSLLTHRSHWSNLGRFLSHYFAWCNFPSSHRISNFKIGNTRIVDNLQSRVWGQCWHNSRLSQFSSWISSSGHFPQGWYPGEQLIVWINQKVKVSPLASLPRHGSFLEI